MASPQLGQDKPRTMAALTSLMTRFCTGEDSWLARSTHNDEAGTSETRDANGKPKRNKNKHRYKNGGSDTEDTAVNAGFTGPKSGQKRKPYKGNKDGPSQLDRLLDRPCGIHGTQENQQHTLIGIVGSSNKPARSWQRVRIKPNTAAMTRMNLDSPIMEGKRNFPMR